MNALHVSCASHRDIGTAKSQTKLSSAFMNDTQQTNGELTVWLVLNTNTIVNCRHLAQMGQEETNKHNHRTSSHEYNKHRYGTAHNALLPGPTPVKKALMRKNTGTTKAETVPTPSPQSSASSVLVAVNVLRLRALKNIGHGVETEKKRVASPRRT